VTPASYLHKPRLLDLFCGAGGAAMGYARAGFEVVGVDIKPQPRYPFAFVEADAIHVLENPWFFNASWTSLDLVAIHASPPCQAFTAYQRTGKVGEYPDLVAQTRELLEETGLPYVIENVEGAPLIDPVKICGSQFDPVMDIRRHRLFETNWPLEPLTWPCRHKLQVSKLYPGGRSKEQGGSNRHLARSTVEIGTWDIPLPVQQEAMGIDWMTLEELSEAIPPAYTEFIGEQLMDSLKTHDEIMYEAATYVRTLSGARDA
jgi:DNA (cytosine-5)-methyltransferase 1